jgi:hypothetical protein
MNDEALVARMLEGQRGLVALSSGSDVALCVGKRMQLRRAARKGQREREEQSQEEGLAHE